MRRSLAVAAALVGLVLVAGPASAEPAPKGGEKGEKTSSGLLETLKGVPPVLGKNGTNNR